MLSRCKNLVLSARRGVSRSRASNLRLVLVWFAMYMLLILFVFLFVV